jgi:hypothetical protein
VRFECEHFEFARFEKAVVHLRRRRCHDFDAAREAVAAAQARPSRRHPLRGVPPPGGPEEAKNA